VFFCKNIAMSFLSLLILLVIASLIGSIGARLGGRRNLGCFGSIALGFIGAFLGTLAAKHFGWPLLWSPIVGGHPFPVIWALIFSSLFVAFLRLISGDKKE